jgi:hypothetical protein
MWDSSVGSIVALLLSLLAVSLAAAAPPAGKVWRIGVVATFYCEESDEAIAFRNGLYDAGYVEGRDIAISWWCGRGSYEHVAEAVADLVQGSSM